YGKLASISKRYAAPIAKHESPKQIARELKLPADKAPTAAATAGVHRAVDSVKSTVTKATAPVAKVTAPVTSTLTHNRLFANPTRPNAFKAGGAKQVVKKAT